MNSTQTAKIETESKNSKDRASGLSLFAGNRKTNQRRVREDQPENQMKSMKYRAGKTLKAQQNQ
jgi:hypothetical protein